MKRFFWFVLMVVGLATMSYAQEKDVNAMAKQANNPLASFKAISLHNVYGASVYGAEMSSNTTWIRYAQPIGRLLIRASLPVNTVNAGTLDKSGLGDMNVFGTIILSEPTARNQFGIGPTFTFPTATSRSLGAGKWQAGVALVAYFGGNPLFQSGLLATWQHSFAGPSNRGKAHVATFQPFLLWQLGGGLYLRSTATNLMDFANDNYLVPLGLGIGKVVVLHKVVFNMFVEPQFTVWHHGNMIPKTQLYMGVNAQF